MNKKGFYGWKLLIVIGCCYSFSSAFVLTAGAVVNPVMMKDLGLSGKMLGLGFTIYILCQGIPSPFIGQLISKIGNKLVYMIGGFLILLGALSMSFIVNNGILYIISFGIILSTATIMAGQINMQSSVSYWFRRKRATAMSIAMVMGSVSSFLAPRIVQKILGTTDGNWHIPWIFVAVLGVVIIIISSLFVVNKPEDIGQVQDGIKEDSDSAGKELASKVFKTTEEITYSQALKTSTFWMIAIAATAAFCCFSLTSSQSVIHFKNMGVDPVKIAALFSWMGLSRLFGTFSIGVLGDKINPARLFTVYLALLVVVIFIAAPHTSKAWVSTVYYLGIGFGFGGCATLAPIVIGNYLGTHSYPKNLGTVMMCTTLVSSLIPIIGGYFLDAVGTVTVVFYITAVIATIGIIATFFISPPKINI